MMNVNPMDGVSQKQIIDVVRRSLSYIDERLIEHGERVAYIAHMIALMDDSLDVNRKNLFILCLLHDIGAYKTEEIDDMVLFEMSSASSHAAYGYVFLRNCTLLGEDAQAILYHHTDYEQLEQMDAPCKTCAELIFLADRIDILLASSEKTDFEPLYRLSGTAFSPHLIALFCAAEEKMDISGHVRDRSYQSYVDALMNAVDVSPMEAMGYLKMLVYSIDFRSPFTVTHTANTTAISGALAELFGMSDDEKRTVVFGAFLHDIGKIAMPYSILEKPGALSAEEIETMRTHVDVSERILTGVVSDEVCQIAIRHHEKLNGSGYHRGLKAADLSLAQRIIAVADILSALISRRSYKEPFSIEKSISILTHMRDAGELCPAVCNMVIEHVDDIMRAVNQGNDPVIKLYETIRRQYGELIDRHAQCDAPEGGFSPCCPAPQGRGEECAD